MQAMNSFFAVQELVGGFLMKEYEIINTILSQT
jgi:hypothetical protein